MITLVDKGEYKLIETKHNVKTLLLGERKYYSWINARSIGELLMASKKPAEIDVILAVGKYRIYKVKNEDQLTDLLHLELSIGRGTWQGFLLPIGLPNGEKRRRIIPTNEIITKSLS